MTIDRATRQSRRAAANQSPSRTDVLSGGPGNDVIFGLNGSDVIDGGPGQDISRGGPDGGGAWRAADVQPILVRHDVKPLQCSAANVSIDERRDWLRSGSFTQGEALRSDYL